MTQDIVYKKLSEIYKGNGRINYETQKILYEWTQKYNIKLPKENN